MSLTIPTHLPNFAVKGVSYTVAAIDLSITTRIGLFQAAAGGGYDGLQPVIDYAGSPSLLADIQAKGGIVQYCAWLKTKINTFLATQFPATGSGGGEPTTESAAIAAVNAWLALQTVTVTNDQPKIV